MSEIETVKLKNGTEEAKPLVVATMLSIKTLMKKQPIAFYDLVLKCRDNSYKPFGINGQVLQDLALLQPDGSVHGSIKNIVLSGAVDMPGGVDIGWGNPVAPDQTDTPEPPSEPSELDEQTKRLLTELHKD